MSAWWFIKARSSYWQGPGRKLQGKGKIMYRAAYHHTVQKWAKLPALMAQPHHISTAYTRLHCIQLSVFTAAQHSVFFQTRTILKTAFLKGNWTVPPWKTRSSRKPCTENKQGQKWSANLLGCGIIGYLNSSVFSQPLWRWQGQGAASLASIFMENLLKDSC